MNTRILNTTFIGEALDESILNTLLSELESDNADEVLQQIVAIISLSTLSLAFESIEDTHQRAAFLHAVPQLLSQKISLHDLSRFRDELPAILTEHITRSLLSLRTKLKS